MKHNHDGFFKPFFKTIDRVIFGIEEPELAPQPEVSPWVIEKKPEDHEDPVVIRSSN
ncbi:MAG: hypothetical protein H0U75_09430 [Legionella sp.]|nr:hypothetical protein [Legionella sp.]